MPIVTSISIQLTHPSGRTSRNAAHKVLPKAGYAPAPRPHLALPLAIANGLSMSLFATGLAVTIWGEGPSAISALIGVIGVCFGIKFPLLQLKRSLRSSAGVSPSSWLILFICVASWAAYGVANQDIYQSTIGLVSLPAIAAVILLAHRHKPVPAAAAAASITAAIVLSIGSASSGTVIPTASLLLSSSAIGILGIASVFRSDSVKGVSIAAVTASTAAQFMWVMHGALESKTVVAAHAVVVIGLNVTLIAAKLIRQTNP